MRTLLVIVGIVSVLCAMVRNAWDAYGREAREEAAILDELNCSVEYCDVGPQWLRSVVPVEGHWRFKRAVAVRFYSVELDERVESLAGLHWLTKLEFHDCSAVDAGLARLSRLRQLEELTVASSHLTDRGMRSIGVLPGLNRLTLFEAPQVTDRGFAELRRVPELESLRLFDGAISDAALDVLADLTRLKQLAVVSDKITDAGAARICSLSYLATLTIGGDALRQIAVSDSSKLESLWIHAASIETLKLQRLPSLTRLGWGGDAMSQSCLRHVVLKDIPRLGRFGTLGAPLRHLQLCNLPSLEFLDVWGPRAPDLEVEGPVGLRCLQLVATPAGDDYLAHLTVFPALEALVLNGAQVTDVGLRHLLRFQRLRLLGLAGTRVTDRGLRELANLPRLEEVDLRRTAVTEKGIEIFQSQKPNVRVLWKGETQEADAPYDGPPIYDDSESLELLEPPSPTN